MSEDQEVKYFIRAFDRNTGIMAVDYPDWGKNGMRINVRLEPDQKTGKVLSGSLLDDYLKKCQPPYVKINNAEDIEKLVKPVESAALSHSKNFAMVPSHVFFARFTDEELGNIWTAAAGNSHIGAILFKLIRIGVFNIADEILKKQIQTIVDANLITKNRMQEIMLPVAD